MFQMAIQIPCNTETMIQMSVVALTKQLTECGLDGSASLNLSHLCPAFCRLWGIDRSGELIDWEFFVPYRG